MTHRGILKTVFRVSAPLLAVAVMLLGLGLMVVATGGLNRELRRHAQGYLSETLGVPVRIGPLEGNPLVGLRMGRAQVGDVDRPYVALDSLVIRYRLLPLLRGRVVVDTLRVHGLQTWVHSPDAQPDGDSEPRPVLAVDPDWWTSGPGWEMEVAHAEVIDGKLALELPGFHDQVDGLDFVAGLRAGSDGYRLELRRFRSLLFDPGLTVTNLQGLVELRDARLAIRDLRLDTQNSHLELDGTVSGLADPEFDFAFHADSLALSDVTQVFPASVGSTRAWIRGWVRGSLSELQTEVEARYGGAEFDISGHLDSSQDDPRYSATVRARNVDLAGLVPDLGVDARFDFVASVEGRGWDPERAEATATVHATRGRLLGVAVDALDLAASLRGGRFSARTSIGGPTCSIGVDLEADLAGFPRTYALAARLDRLDPSQIQGAPEVVTGVKGRILLRKIGSEAWWARATLGSVVIGGMGATDLTFLGTLEQGVVQVDSLGFRLPEGYGRVGGKGRVDLGRFWTPGSGRPTYDLALLVDGVAVDRVTGSAQLAGPAACRLALSGSGFDPDSVEARADLEVDAPTLMGVGLDSARASLVQKGRHITLERLDLVSPLIHLEGDGWVSAWDSLSVRAEGRIVDPGLLSRSLGLELYGSSIGFKADASGTWSAPEVGLALWADSLTVVGVPMTALEMKAKWPVLTSGGMLFQAGSVEWGRRTVQNLTLHAGLAGRDVVFLLGNSPEDRDQVHLRGRIGKIRDGYRLQLDSLAVDVEQLALRNRGPCRAGYDLVRGLSVERFQLGGPAGRIEARDDPAAPGSVRVQLDKVDLRTWSFLLGLGQGIGGTLSGDFGVSGTIERPVVKGRCDLVQGRFAGVAFEGLSGRIDYADDRVGLDLVFVQKPGREAVVVGSFPVGILSGRWGEDPAAGPVDLHLASGGIDAGFIPALLRDVQNAAGTLSAELRLRGTSDDLRPEGWLRLDSGKARLGFLNKDFSGIDAVLRFSPDRIAVESFRVGQGRQNLSLAGEARLKGSALGEIQGRVRAEHFEVVDLPELTAILQADVTLAGTLREPRVDGKVQLERAVVRLSDFLEAPPEAESLWETSAFLRGLAGTVRVSATRNVWIRDRDLNVEISGDLDVVKAAGGIRIYGSLASRRGRYDFQNTSFDIDQGEIQFQGKEEIDPDLYILATHRLVLVSSERAVISAIVGGTLLYPRITLESDTTPPLSEADMLSYLVLGRPSENVIGGAQETGDGKPGLEGQAAGLVLGVAANQLKRQIGRQLNLDLVEIDMGGGSGSTRVRVGKYIGTKLFVSYAQDVSSARAQEVTVEYELLPQVTLEAQQRSGSDTQRDRKSLGVFWKLEW